MKGTKQKILDASRYLFNNFGYNQVTIRMIASELEMSSGNLNYHFRKREDILEALYFEMVEVFDRRVRTIEVQKISLEFMQSNIQSSMKRMVDYRFFWTDLYHLLKSNTKIKAHFTNAKAERVSGYKLIFDFWVKENIMEKPSYAREHLFLINRMIDYSNTWLYASELYEHKQDRMEIIEQACFHLLAMLYPNLTSLGQEDFRKLYSDILA